MGALLRNQPVQGALVFQTFTISVQPLVIRISESLVVRVATAISLLRPRDDAFAELTGRVDSHLICEVPRPIAAVR